MVQPFKISAIAVLSGKDKFLTADEIVKRAVQKGLLDADKMTDAPARTMSAVLSNNIRQRGSDSEFVRRDDLFGLNPETDAGGAGPASDGDPRQAAAPNGQSLPADRASPTPDAANQALFNGRAGEYSVVSELLFHGFDACVANVDEGTDVFAVKGGRCFFLQVKTSVPVGNRCSFFVSPGAHKKFNRPDAYYAFVMRSGTGNDFLVMPYCEVQKQMESGRIERLDRKYRASFVWGDKITLGGADATYYRRRWPEA